MCFSCVQGCNVLFTHVKASYINRKHIQSSHTVRLRTALWRIQVCLSSTPRKQINRAQGRVSSKSSPVALTVLYWFIALMCKSAIFKKLTVLNTFFWHWCCRNCCLAPSHTPYRTVGQDTTHLFFWGRKKGTPVQEFNKFDSSSVHWDSSLKPCQNIFFHMSMI